MRSGFGNLFSGKKERSKTRSKKKLITNAGVPISDNQNMLAAGPRGMQLLQDIWFWEKLAHFDREVLPERRMHAKGTGS
jgi:catalase